MLKDVKKYEKNIKKNKIDKKWVGIITVIAFIISLCLSLASELVIPNSFLAINIILVLLFIVLGILFDVVGLSVVSSDPKVFHSMAANKVKGAREAINMIKKKDKVSSFCNDVIGDICGVVSGSCGITIALKISTILNYNAIIVTVIVTSIISALTIGGKAIGKTIAVNKANEIVYEFAKIINIFKINKKY